MVKSGFSCKNEESKQRQVCTLDKEPPRVGDLTPANWAIANEIPGSFPAD